MANLFERCNKIMQALTKDQREELEEMDVYPEILEIVKNNEIDVVAAREVVALIPREEENQDQEEENEEEEENSSLSSKE